MAKIAFLLLAHKDPDRVIAQAQTLTAHGDCVAIHYDARAPHADARRIKAALADTPGVAFAKRVRCGWGQFSLVQATLNLIQTARRRFTQITHYYLISGDCYPTKSRSFFDRFLGEDTDFIESHDFFNGGWIKTGLKEERLIYRHWVNERERKRMFYALMEVQRRLRLERPTPEGVKIRIGSQWWALRAQTVERVLDLLDERPDLVRFFRTTWIPDETFFQTLVSHVTDSSQIRRTPPTHLMFSDYGMPVVFHTDHFDYLRSQDSLFARKLSTHSEGLRSRLLDAFREPESERPEGGTGAQLYGYLAGRGRHGQRYRPRFWETAIGERRDKDVLIIVSKLWHIGKVIEAASASATGYRSLGYLFDEDIDPRISLGNLEHGIDKRGRHRQALMNLIFDTTRDERVLLTVDPSRADVIEDIAGKVGSVRLLLIERPIPETHVLDHAQRVGLFGPSSGEFERHEAIRAISYEFQTEIDHIKRCYKHTLHRNDLSRDRAENVRDLEWFLHCPTDKAEAIALRAEQQTI